MLQLMAIARVVIRRRWKAATRHEAIDVQLRGLACMNSFSSTNEPSSITFPLIHALLYSGQDHYQSSPASVLDRKMPIKAREPYRDSQN